MNDYFNSLFLSIPSKSVCTVAFIVLFGGAAVTYQQCSRLQDIEGIDTDDEPENSEGIISLSGKEEDEFFDKLTRSAASVEHKQFQSPSVKADVPIEDPTKAMYAFYNALHKLEKNENTHQAVRVIHYGDSILTTDELTNAVRNRLQDRFGDGGHGFVLLGRPWRWYRHIGVTHGADRKWRARPMSADPIKDGLMGLGAVAFETESKGATVWAGTAEEGDFGKIAETFELSYLVQPKGGTFDILIDDVFRESISTNSAEKKSAHHIVKVPIGPAKLTIRTKGDGPVRVFGVVIENGSSGVVYDTIAVNGARISNFDRIDPEHFQSELRLRNPNLVIMMCGANEGNNDALSLNYYKEQLAGLLRRIRAALPDASCLVMGPMDQATMTESGELESKKMPRKLSRVQQEVSAEQNCAFFNTFSAMGGNGSMPKWVKRGLAGGDYIHPTDQGARIIGNRLTDALLAGYENFVLNEVPCESNATSL